MTTIVSKQRLTFSQKSLPLILTMQLLIVRIQRCVAILIQNKIWCSLFECFCSTELFSWLFYKLWVDSWKTPTMVIFTINIPTLVHTCWNSPILHWSYNNTTKWKVNKVARAILRCENDFLSEFVEFSLHKEVKGLSWLCRHIFRSLQAMKMLWHSSRTRVITFYPIRKNNNNVSLILYGPKENWWQIYMTYYVQKDNFSPLKSEQDKLHHMWWIMPPLIINILPF